MRVLVVIVGIIFDLANATSSIQKQCTPACGKGYTCRINTCVMDVQCPPALKFGSGPPASCTAPSDPRKLPRSPLEDWFTEDVFNDLFPKANLGWGSNACWPYSYQSFVIAARYFPRFGTEAPQNGYTAEQNYKRDLAAFFSHAVQETGENDASLYGPGKVKANADACFYRGGFYNWFEGGPTSLFLSKDHPGHQPQDGAKCNVAGKYCIRGPDFDYFFKCNEDKDGVMYKGCYFGRGAIQISYNFNYGQFQQWLKEQNIDVNLLKEPNLIMTKMDPPLAILASLWFYMTPQPPKPAMHDIVLGQWEAGTVNKKAGYQGAIFGPTSLVINNECNGEDPTEPGGPGESRRIKAFKWFTNYFGVPAGPEKTLSCKDMAQRFDSIPQSVSWQPDWSTSWKDEPCNCAPASYGGMIPYFQPGSYPDSFVRQNEANRIKCIRTIYAKPELYSMNAGSSKCLEKPSPFVNP